MSGALSCSATRMYHRAVGVSIDSLDSDDHTRGLGVPAKPEHHGGGEHGTLVQLRRSEAAEGKRSQEDGRGSRSRRMMDDK